MKYYGSYKNTIIIYNPKNSYIFYYKAKLPHIIENPQNLFNLKLGYNES